MTSHEVNNINMAFAKKDTMNETLQKNVETVLTGADGVPLSEIDSRLEELQKELLKVANSKGNYDAIADEIYRLREVRQNALVENAEREGIKNASARCSSSFQSKCRRPPNTMSSWFVG